eukprot:SAG31_NODE_10893_length_1086_cov_1.612969_1_plen_118_part_00
MGHRACLVPPAAPQPHNDLSASPRAAPALVAPAPVEAAQLLGCRLRRVLQHLRGGAPVKQRSGAAFELAVASQRAGGVDPLLLSDHLQALRRDGVTVIDRVYSAEQVAEWRRKLIQV